MKKNSSFLLALAIALLVLTGLSNGGTARAGGMFQPHSGASAIITVNTLADENDGSCSNGDCSLRDAIQVTNPGDTIRFSVSGFIILDLGALTINKNLTIEGPELEFLAISAEGSSRVLYVDTGANVIISNIEISDGVSDYGGGVYNRGTLTVNNSSIRNSYATESGGGIYNAANGVLAVTTSTIADNGAAQNGGGIDNQGALTIIGSEIRDNGTESGNGGGIHNQGTLTITTSIIAGNYAVAYGGGIYNSSGRTLIITQSEIRDNSADSGGGVENRGVLSITSSEINDNGAEAGGGGGIQNLQTLTITDSTWAGNSSATYGGGIFVNGAAQTIVTNSTFHDNVSSQGGGIAIVNASITVTNATLFRNEAATGGGIYSSGTPPQTVLRNTIVAGSTVGGGCAGAMATTSTHNLNTDASCSPGFTQVTTETLKLTWEDDGLLGLEASSVAIDNGSNDFCPVTDQRGVSRPQDGNGDGYAVCDVGAYEFVMYRLYLPLVLRNAAVKSAKNLTPRDDKQIRFGTEGNDR